MLSVPSECGFFPQTVNHVGLIVLTTTPRIRQNPRFGFDDRTRMLPLLLETTRARFKPWPRRALSKELPECLSLVQSQ